MGDDWVDRVIGETQNWTGIEAERFIAFLESEGISLDSILVILKATDYLHALKSGPITFILEEESVLVPEEAVQTYQHTGEVASQAQTASDVFISFARQQFRRELEEKGKFLEGEAFEDAFKKKMGKKGEWEKKIFKDTTSNSKWTVQDAKSFLEFLTKRIGESATLKAMKITSFFQLTNYENFILRFDVFSKYVDVERMTEQLQKCLTCFLKELPIS